MKQRIRIVHVCDKFGIGGSSVHGVGRLFSWWIPRFDKERYDVELVGLRGDDNGSKRLREGGIKLQCLNRGKFDPATLPSLVRLFRGADVVHLHGYGATTFGRVAARVTGARSVIHEHFVDPSVPTYQRMADLALSGMVDTAVAVSNSVSRFMTEKRHIHPSRVRLVYNGAPLAEFRPLEGADRATERAKWSIPEGWPVVGTVGRLDEQKGLSYFIEAAALLSAEGVKAKFLIVGDGPLLEPLKRLAADKGVAEDVVFAGYASDVRPLQSIFDVQVFPSLWEGTPLTVFEAMAMGRAIVSTDVDGLGEVLSSNRNAVLVGARDSRGLAHGIGKVLRDPAHAATLAEHAKSDSLQFDIDKTVQQLQSIYEELTCGGRAEKRQVSQGAGRP